MPWTSADQASNEGMDRECFEDIAIDSEICQLHREWIGSGSLFHPIDIFYTRRSDQRSGVCSAMVYSLPHGLHGGLRSAVQKILLAWVFRWHLVDLPPSRVFSAADAALSLGAESGKSKECRGMCFSRIRSKGSRFTLGAGG